MLLVFTHSQKGVCVGRVTIVEIPTRYEVHHDNKAKEESHEAGKEDEWPVAMAPF